MMIKKASFSQKEMTDLFYQMVLAHSMVEDTHMDYYNISDENIFIDKMGQFKIGFNIRDSEEKITKIVPNEFFFSP